MTSLLCALLAVSSVLGPPNCDAPEVEQSAPTLLERFLARSEEVPVEYRAMRHLEAKSAHFSQGATMEVLTEYDSAKGFRYQIVSETGSSYIRKRVFLGWLEGEKKMWANREPQQASFTRENYTFQDGPPSADGLASLIVKPRRKDLLLVEGSVFVHPHEGDLVRIEGRLSKTPSFWTRKVDVVRRYARMAGVLVPVSFETVASVLLAGRSTFTMTFDYETINGQRIKPQPTP